ncbi:MAG: nitroreductase family protein [Romboutsia sp.]|uniref:nitroreductase family protein n=1 Tax=Romboutsia sp. TaxID=1965302 RepID=UPI003F34B7B0
MKSIMERRSIRKYAEDKVLIEDIKELLRAAMQAPSAGNSQPWEFIVVDDKEKLVEVTEVHKYSFMFPSASYGIVVCATPDKEIHKGYWPQDCAAAVENMLIKANDMGLGAVWLGVYPEEDRVVALRKIFEVDENVVPFAIVSVGYPNEEKKFDDRYDEGKVFYNTYKNK